MASILEIRTPWRDALLPASYKGVEFHVEATGEDGGRRLVVHEYPKKDRPYAEDMGRRAYGFNVRAYCIAFPSDTALPLYQRDYRILRDRLRQALSEGGAGRLQMPTFPAVIVAVDRYRCTEETRYGGYCTFDIQFVEQGVDPPPPQQSSRDSLIERSQALIARVLQNLANA
jgi:prophage DNA circulation protein